MPVTTEKPSLASLIAVGVVAGATLAYQVILTRLFSAALSYHFSFLAISIALLGTGGGALFVYVSERRYGALTLPDLLSRWCQLFGLFLILTPLLLVRLDFTTTGVPFALTLALACGAASLPPFAAGAVITLAISGYTRFIGTVYAFDLLGAGLGALVVVPTLWLAPAPDLLVALGVIMALVALLFGRESKQAPTSALACAGLGVALLVASSLTSVLYLPTGYLVGAETVTKAERWTPLSRVFGFERPANAKAGRMAAIFYDRVYAPVAIVETDVLPTWKNLHIGPQSIGYELTGPGHALIIGGGGGRDIYNALSSGQNPVDVIELNEGIRRVVDEDLGYLSGKPYSRSGVHTTVGDGRSVLAARETKYDQIHIGFTDTLSANAAQGFALTENNLYTLEAFQVYLEHLKPGGILNVSRPLKLVGEEALKMTVLTLAALERYGVENPKNNMVVVLGKDVLGPLNGTVLARLTPYTPEELELIARLAEERGEGIAFAPGGPYLGEWKGLAEAKDSQSFCDNYHLNVCPPSDDRPFFFSMQRFSLLGTASSGSLYSADPFSILMLTLGVLTLLSLFAFVAPLALVGGTRPDLSSLSYFAAIGLGFLLVEIVLIQRFVLLLGYPTYALSVVLFALLTSTGLGSALSERVSDDRRGVMAALSLGIALILASAFVLEPLVNRMIALPFAVRAGFAVLALAPFGITLGMAMPIGLRRFEALYGSAVPYAWAVNGFASVLASVLGVAFAIQMGFTATLLLACVCYAVALADAAMGRWPSDAS